MKLKGIGVDIESIDRFRRKPFVKNKLFYEGVFLQDEIAYCLNYKDPYPHFTARFCAKEAFAKALNRQVKLKDIKVINDISGKPGLEYKNLKAELSLSHTQDLAVAFVILK